MNRLPAYVLTDAGPLIALVDKKVPEHNLVLATLSSLPKLPLLTTWPCFAEAMYLLQKSGGQPAQDGLWNYVDAGILQFHDLSSIEQQRMRGLMAQYASTPMDLADASLVVAAESLGLRQGFTLDDDFYHYRLADGSVLQVIP